MTKPFLKSKTVWVNLLTAVPSVGALMLAMLGDLQTLGVSSDTTVVAGAVIALAISIANILLRLVTSTAVTLK